MAGVETGVAGRGGAEAVRPGPSARLRGLWRRLVEFAPAIGIAAIAALVGAVVLLVERDERTTRERALIDATLAVEQAIDFQIASLAEGVARLAADAATGLSGEALAARFRVLVAGNPELVGLALHAPDGTVTVAYPPGIVIDPVLTSEVGREARRFALATGRTRSSGAAPLANGEQGVVVALPALRGEAAVATVSAVISLPAVLHRHVPWWVLQSYRVAIQDVGGVVHATKSQLDRDGEAEGARHTIALGAPLSEFYLVVAARDARTKLLENGVVGVVVLFALAAIASLFAVQRHMRRRRAAELALRAETAFRRAMEDSLTVGMRARDLEGRIVYVNPAFCRMTGFPASELVGRAPPMPYWLPEDIERTRAIHDRVLAGDAPPQGFEIRFRRADGSVFDALIYEAPLIDAEGRHAGWMASVLDVTDRRKAEALARAQSDAMARTARLVTMGETASTLAHELNQPLAAIASYAAGGLNLVQAGGAAVDRDLLADAFGKIAGQAQRAGGIIGRTRDLVRRRDPVLKPLDPAKLLADTARLLEADFAKAAVRLELRAAGALPRVEGDALLLQQVLVNLIRNALEAMEKAPQAERTVEADVAADGEGVRFTVADRGPGVPPEVEDALFAPFLTTKAEGMGIGLNICRSIVELHRGRLEHRRRPEGGAIFTFDVPARPR